MIVIYGKWKVGKWLHDLLTHVDIDHALMDDMDRDDMMLKNAEYIVMSPGIKPSHDVYALYWEKILSELSYLGIIMKTLMLPKATFIGITWTNGKSTTSWIMYQALQKLFPTKGVWLTGNFDIPLSQTLLSIMKDWSDKEHICVVETSSFMLYKLKDFTFDYSIWLNIARDHLDRHLTMEAYTYAKMAICIHTRKWFIGQWLFDLLPDEAKVYNTPIDPIYDISYTNFLWKHNMENIAAVISCITHIAIDRWVSLNIKEIFPNIVPLPHRIQTIKTIDGIRIVDDGIGTSAQSLLAALDAMDDRCVLIVGGYDKWDDYSILRSLFLNKVWHAVCLGQNKHIFADIAKDVWVPYILENSLKDAVSTAINVARKYHFSIVLYSPWSASFDMFVNVYDRVEQFNQIVSWLS